MDPLTDVLELARVSGAVLAQLVAPAPWGVVIDAQGGAVFHAVLAGSCWVQMPGESAVQLMPGDVVLLPNRNAHTLSSDLDAPLMHLDEATKASLSNREGAIELPGEGAVTRILCAKYDYDHDVAQPLMSLLPRLLHLPAGVPGDGEAIAAILRLLRCELGEPPGARATTGRLIDVLFVHVIRSWLTTTPTDDACWLHALRDPVIAKTLALLHERPEHPWTVDALASVAHVSRSTLTRRFTELVGESPLAYLTRWRMDLAAQRLRATDQAIALIADSVGYTSEYAFSRAFSRARGQPPGRYRAHTRRSASGSEADQ